MARGGVGQQELLPYESLIGQNLELKGVVSEDPDKGGNAELVLRLQGIVVSKHAIAGSIWVSAGAKPDIKRGDIVTVRGKLSAGFGSFSASMYRAEIIKAERPYPGDVAGRVRDWFADSVREGVSEPEASLGIGYLVGQRRGLPPELDEALKIAGLSHIVVASGYNLTILVRLARRLFAKISRYMALFAGGSMITAFIMVTGMSPSMSRAGLIAGLSLLVWYYGRTFQPLVLLPFAAAITLLVNPSFGWNDLGWQLSFAAFAGVMIVAPLLQSYFFGDEKPSMIRQIVGETIAAQICTLPILILAFGQFSNVAIVANLLVLPLVPFAMLLTFIAGVGSLITPPLAGVFGAPASWILEYMTSVAIYLAGLPWAQTTLAVSSFTVTIMYASIAGVCWYMWRKTRLNLRKANLVE